MVGEYFEEPAVVGCALSIRAKNNILSVWTRRNDTYLCFKLGYSPLSLQALLMVYAAKQLKSCSTWTLLFPWNTSIIAAPWKINLLTEMDELIFFRAIHMPPILFKKFWHRSFSVQFYCCFSFIQAMSILIQHVVASATQAWAIVGGCRQSPENHTPCLIFFFFLI